MGRDEKGCLLSTKKKAAVDVDVDVDVDQQAALINTLNKSLYQKYLKNSKFWK